MPPLKEYRFEHDTPANVEIIIMSYSFEQAYEILVSITKHPADYKCINV